MADRSIAYKLALDTTGFQQGARNAAAALRQIGKDGVEYTEKKLGHLQKSVKDHGEAWSHAGKASLAFGTGVAVSLGMATKAAMSWQSAWAGVTKTVSGSQRQMDALQAGLRKLASSDLPASHEQIAAVAAAAGQLGIKTGNVLSFTKTMIDMGESTNLSADEAATSLARFMNIMGTSQSNVGKLGASIVGLGNNFATTESEIMDMAMRIAGAGKQAHMSEGDVLGFATALSSVGIEAEAGGTAISMVMKRMGNEVSDGGSKLDQFAKVAGMSSGQFAKAWGKDSAGAMQLFVKGLGEAQKHGENVNKTLSALGITGIRESDALLRLSASSGVLKDALATGNAEYAKGIALIQEASKRYQTAESRVKIATNSIKDAAIGFGDVLLPYLAKAADSVSNLAQWFGKLPQPVKEATVGIAGVGGTAALAAGGFLTLAPKVFETVDGIKELAKVHPKAAAGLKNLGKAAGIATAAFVVLQVASAATNGVVDSSAESVDKLANRLVEMQKGIKPGVTKNTILDPAIWDNANKTMARFSDLGDSNITGWGDALKKTEGWVSGMNRWVDSITGFRGQATQLQDTIGNTDKALTQLAQGGSMDTAAQGFTQIAKEAEANGVSLHDLFERFPEYTAYLDQVATAAGLTADDQTRLKIATGQITPEMLAAGSATDEQAKKLQGLGIDAKTTQQQIKDLADEIRGFGSTTLDERKAERDYQEAIDGVRDSLKKNGKSLDDHTKKGRANGDALDQLAKSANDSAAALLENGGSEKELVTHMAASRKQIIAAAKAFGMSKDQAEAYADAVQMTPKEVKTRVKTDGSKKAGDQITGVKKKADTLSKSKPKVNVYANTDPAKSDVNKFGQWLADHSFIVWLKRKYVDSAPPSKTVQKGGDDAQTQAGSTGGWAAGGIAVKRMAAGSVLSPMDKTAQMVEPNTWRVVGDRLDVDEAFIPLDGSRRSWAILAQAMKRMPGMLPMAKGGVVSRAKSQVNNLEDQLKKARRAKAGDKKVNALEDKLDKAKDALAKAEAAEQKAKEKAQAAKERRQRISEARSSLRTDVRRGDVRSEVTGGLDSAYSAVDRLYDQGKNGDLSKRTRSRATSQAKSYERSLKGLYGQVTTLEKKLDSAKSKLDDLKQIQQDVASSIQGNAYKLDVSSQWSQDAKGKWTQTVGVKGAVTNAKAAAAKVKGLSSKIGKLQKMGYSGAILQEVTGAGSIDESISMADELLKGSKSDVKSLNASYKDIEKYSNTAGANVTKAFYKGGVDAAAGLVKGLESQDKRLEKSIAKIAKKLEKSLKKNLGIHSPSKLAADITKWFPIGAAAGIEDNADVLADAGTALAGKLATGFSAGMPSAAGMVAPVSSALAGVQAPAGSSSVFSQQPAAAPDAGPAAATSQAPAAASSEENAKSTVESLSTMQDATSEAYEAMTKTTVDSLQASQDKTVAVTGAMTQAQADMLDSMTAKQTDQYKAMRKNQSKTLDSMQDSNKSGFKAIRDKSDDLLRDMRKQNDSTMGKHNSDFSDRLGKAKKLSRAGFGTIKDSGVSGFKGIRSGMNSQMGQAYPDMGGKLNRVIGLQGKFVNSVNKAFGEVGVKLGAPKALKYAAGGTLPGHTPGRDIYNFRDQDGRELHLGGGESIMTTRFTDAVGEDWVKSANAAAEKGGKRGVFNFMSRGGEELRNIGSYAKGGTLRNLDKAKRFAAAQDGKKYHWAHSGPRDYDCSGFQSAIINVLLGRYPYRRIFATGSSGGAHWGPLVKGKGTYTAGVYHGHTSGTLDGVNVEATTGHGGGRTGVKYGHGARSATNPMFRWQYKLPEDKGMFVPGDDSARAAVMPKFLTDAGIKDFPSNMKKAFQKASAYHLKKARAKIAPDIAKLPAGFYQESTNGILDEAGKGITKKAVAYAKNMTFSGGANSNMESWRSLVAQALKISGIGGGKADENLWLKQIQTESSGNPKLVQSSALKDINVLRGDPARGLVQVPGVTWADFGHGMGKFIPNVYDPLKNLIVGMRAAYAQHGHSNWRRAIGKGHGYATGTKSALPGYKWVGEDGPELVKFKGGEQVIPSKASAAVENQVLRTQQTITLAPETVAELKAGQGAGLDAKQVAKAIDGMQVTLMVDGKPMAAFVSTTVNMGISNARSNIARGSNLVGAR